MKWRLVGLMLLAGCAAAEAGAAEADTKALAEDVLRSAGVGGGLCVHLGCGGGTLTAELAASGRFLVHGIESDAARAESARKLIHSRGLYGIAWVEERPLSPLPYAENLVNLIVMDDMPERGGPPLREVLRALAPGGVAWLGQSNEAARHGTPLIAELLKRRLARLGFEEGEVIQRRGLWVRIQKPWPEEMDDWSHPRHGPDGNAASRDSLVGPPRRVRWLAGPWHEASNMVTAGGRLYHSGLIARDAFNGLRLWGQPLTPAPLRLGFPAMAAAGSVVPVIAHDRLFALTDKQVVALDPASGRTLRAYPGAGAPSEILHDKGVLYAAAKTWVRALDATDGKLLWTAKGKEIDGLVTGDGGVFCLEGDVKAGEKRSLLCLDRGTGRERWKKDDYPWLPRARRLSHGSDILICEVSTLKDDKPGNAIEVLSARDGSLLWERVYEPGMSHYTQARAIHTAGLVWVLLAKKWEGLDPRTGSVVKTCDASGGHCFPPVGTPRFLISGEMSFADIATGKLDANRITKGNCSREAGFMPANGLLYVGPKHCACWPMLRGYAALAPAGGPTEGMTGEPPAPLIEKGPAYSETRNPKPEAGNASEEWPSYRADCWRSASTTGTVPSELEVLWTARLGGWPQSPLTQDWKDNLHSRGVLTPPVAADGLAIVARPEAHQVVALDAATGQRRWDFTGNGRVDTAPTLHAGLCLFGTRSGWVYCLRAADGQLVWRLRAAPHEERIVAFGQVESPWPVPGSVLVLDGVAYFAAGRQPLADGGILVFAVEPATGKALWMKRLNTLPMTAFYGSLALEFDPFDLLIAEDPKPTSVEAGMPPQGPAFVTLSRWRFAPKTGAMTVAPKSGFTFSRTGGSGVMAPRGVWSYGPRMSYTFTPNVIHSVPRPLVAFRDSTLVGTSEDGRQLFRTDFALPSLAEFNDLWYTQGQVPRKKEDKGDRNRNERLARNAKWATEVFPDPKGPGIAALVLAGDTVFAAGRDGRLFAFAAADGSKLAERGLPPPVWDGLAAAYGKLFVATQGGDVICLGKK